MDGGLKQLDKYRNEPVYIRPTYGGHNRGSKDHRVGPVPGVAVPVTGYGDSLSGSLGHYLRKYTSLV